MHRPDWKHAVAGLSSAEAAARLAADGPNELPQARPRTALRIALDVLRQPMVLLLVACATIYGLLGEADQAAALGASVLFVFGIVLVQSRKTENALAALRNLASPRALVIRDGREQRIAGRDVVRGDAILLMEGDRIPADGRMIVARGLVVDEAILTGESVAVEKLAADDGGDDGAGDRSRVYSGTLVVAGQALMSAEATGAASALGRIGRSLGEIGERPGRVESDTTRLVWIAAIIGIALCVLLALVLWLRNGNLLEAFLAGLTLAMAILPEELPLVLTVFLAIGAWRIAKRRVLTRKLAAIESLGAATVLAVDKTGTLTQNVMQVVATWRPGEPPPSVAAQGIADSGPTEHERALLHIATLACSREPFDPTEQAIQRGFIASGGALERAFAQVALEHEYAFSAQRPAMTRVWRRDAQRLAAAKGAPEAMLALCDVRGDERDAALAAVDALAREGLRVLGVGEARFDARANEPLPEAPDALGLRFVGLLALHDPLRPAVPQAVGECRTAGIRVVIITGDYPATAAAIARRIGLGAAPVTLTGAELDALDDASLAARVRGVDVFCRVRPEQKLRIVRALQAAGDVAAMTGDGVNDAPALRAADVGVAMGARGSDVARESADLVLLDDDFGAIVDAVRLGRRIFDNLKQAFVFLVAVHVPTIGLAFAPSLAGTPFLLAPIHIVFLEFFIDPACTVALEAEEADPGTMQRPPRDPHASVFDGAAFTAGLAQGVVSLAATLGLYLVLLMRGADAETTRTTVFAALVLANVGLILASRSAARSLFATLIKPNRALWAVVAVTCAALIAAIYIPALAALFRFAPLDAAHAALALAVAAIATLGFEAVKRMRWRER